MRFKISEDFERLMDNRDKYYEMLGAFAMRNGYDSLPKAHRVHIDAKLEQVVWREDKKILKKLHKASKKAAKNKGLTR